MELDRFEFGLVLKALDEKLDHMSPFCALAGHYRTLREKLEKE